ncbi:hypothetical protein [Alteromonas sp. 14N.309.X.WAT.G.H12]|uniref:hypothetical protein n=1 Tax=Alteromonas sp. 14N.309.X.WAT.G.H12 TaxID=3120824 RepID=UPI002FD087A8
METGHTKPSVGDRVICTAGSLIGSIGYIGDANVSGSSYPLYFHARPFFDGDTFSFSGGLRQYANSSEILNTGKTTRFTVELCEAGYTGLPNGEKQVCDVALWEYRDPSPSPFTGIFSIDDIANRGFADYDFVKQDSPSPLVKTFNKESDFVGRAIFNAAKQFEPLSWTRKNGVYVVKAGFNVLGEHPNTKAFEQFIQAYKLTWHEVENGCGYIVPNMDVADWAPSGWRERTDKPISY